VKTEPSIATHNKDRLEELALRCVEASGPDRKLDALIASVTGWQDVRGEGYGVWRGIRPTRSRRETVLRFTASLDAAMTLVPEGWRFVIDNDGCHCRMTRRSRQGSDIYGFAGSMALALCAAALRARAQLEATHV